VHHVGNLYDHLPGKFLKCYVLTFIRPSCALNALSIASTLI